MADEDSKYSSYPKDYDAKVKTNTARDANTDKFTKGPLRASRLLTDDEKAKATAASKNPNNMTGTGMVDKARQAIKEHQQELNDI